MVSSAIGTNEDAVILGDLERNAIIQVAIPYFGTSQGDTTKVCQSATL